MPLGRFACLELLPYLLQS